MVAKVLMSDDRLAPLVDQHSPSSRSSPYRVYVIGALSTVYTLSLMDQGLMSLVLESIKKDLRLSDSQLGTLTGIVFGLFYATLALPIARWSDRGNRPSIASAALALWAAMVMIPIMVTTFGQLVCARMAAAIGGAGCMPPTYSLVGDYYPEAGPRARAMSVYMLANPLSLLLSFGVGGWLTEHYGWRMAFFLFGLPGLLVAAIVRLSVSEPRHARTDSLTASREEPIRGVLKTLWVKRSTRQLLFALALIYILGFGTMPWYAAFMMRSHHMGTAELGVWFGIILGVGGIVGALAGGYVTARWFANDERNQLRFVAVTIVSLVPCFFLFLLAASKLAALASLAVLMVIWNMYVGPTFAILQRLVADDIRATTLAVIMLICNLIGMGLGPQIVGSLSDALTSIAGADALRYAILVVSLSAAWSGCHFWRAGRTIRGDLVFPSVGLAPQKDNEGQNVQMVALDHT